MFFLRQAFLLGEGSLSHWCLNPTQPSLQDLVLDPSDSDFEITFGRGFLGITDFEFGPDGFLYVLSIGDGTINRIVPSSFIAESKETVIPNWIQKLFFWWEDNQIDDHTFLKGLEFLINESIIVLKHLPDEVKRQVMKYLMNLKKILHNGSWELSQMIFLLLH